MAGGNLCTSVPTATEIVPAGLTLPAPPFQHSKNEHRSALPLEELTRKPAIILRSAIVGGVALDEDSPPVPVMEPYGVRMLDVPSFLPTADTLRTLFY